MSADHLTPADPLAKPAGKDFPRAPRGKLPRLRDFSDLDDEAFVEAAYGAVLNRRSDPGGAAHYRELLAQGISRAEILTSLIDSPEGRATGYRMAGLEWARRWARIGRLPILSGVLAFGRRMSPLTGVRRELRTATQRLTHLTARVQLLELETAQRELEAQRRLDGLRVELMRAVAAHADLGEFRALQAALRDLNSLVDTLVTALPQLEQSKADRTALDHVRDELRSTLYRGVDDVDRKFRLLLDAKAGSDALADLSATLDHRLHILQQESERRLQALDAGKADADALTAVQHMQQELERQVHAVDARKADADALSAVQHLQQELERQVHAVDARKADSGTIDAAHREMLADLRSLQDTAGTLRSLLDGKAATDAVTAVGAALDDKLQRMRQELERQVQVVDARKADSGAIDAVRDEMLAALRTALTGLTGSVSAVAASRVDRATLSALLAENSRTLEARFHAAVRELRTSIEELSVR